MVLTAAEDWSANCREH